MGRVVRMVPPDWNHPRYDENHPEVVNEGRFYLVGRYIPMWDHDYEISYDEWKNEELPEWEEGHILWENGYVWHYPDGDYDKEKELILIDELIANQRKTAPEYRPLPENPDYRWWAGTSPIAPNPENYMPNWPVEKRTHYMMYEDTSEGTPISPAFETPEELARWLADTGASAFGGFTATYEQWLSTIGRGYAMSMVADENGLRSGVEAQADAT